MKIYTCNLDQYDKVIGQDICVKLLSTFSMILNMISFVERNQFPLAVIMNYLSGNISLCFHLNTCSLEQVYKEGFIKKCIGVKYQFRTTYSAKKF